MQRTIWSCALEEDVEALEELIAGGVGVDSINDLGETALHLAASRGLECVATVLLARGADVHAKDWESGWTPLHRSLYFGHIRLSLLLLQAGALLDGGRERHASKGQGRARPRSESLGSSTKYPGSTTSARRRGDSLGDGDGNSPLDVLSLELRSRLKTSREQGTGGDVYSFGKADFFLGYDSFEKADVIRPRRVESLANLQVTRIAASRFHSAAVTLCGKLYTWGHGRSGRLGHGNEDVCMLPTLVEGLANQRVRDVAASETHSAALTAEGELYTWGRDRFGQLGHGPSSSGRLAPKRVEALRKTFLVGLATGTEHTAVVSESGTCYTWGRNNHGQLGFEGLNQTSSPRSVSYLGKGASRGAGGVGRFVLKVSASARNTVVVTRGVDKGSGLRPVNEVYQWGHGSHVPSRVKFDSPKDAAPTARWRTHDARVDITDVAAAKHHNLALSAAGRVFTWGFGADNLGLDPREARTCRGPQLVAALLPESCGGNAVYISAAEQHSCVVTDNGDLYTWGAVGEDGGALGHGKKRWQPVAKRVPGLKKVASVAAAPDHTVVLLQAFCPSLPHGLSFLSEMTAREKTEGGDGRAVEAGDDDHDDDYEELFGDSDSDDEFGNEAVSDFSLGDRVKTSKAAGAGANASSASLTLKQRCEVVLAREVDLTNVSSVLAYADVLDAPALVQYCAEYVRSNLDGVLILGRESDRACILETTGALARSLLCTGTSSAPSSRLKGDVTSAEASSMFGHHHEEEGVNREAMATALARAEMRAKTPSAKVAARAVRSLKKKIARIVELEGMRESGKRLSEEQESRVQLKARMQTELNSLASQLERAQLAQAARTQRLQTAAEENPIIQGRAKLTTGSSSAKRTLFSDEHPTQDAKIGSEEGTAKEPSWTPQLDLTLPSDQTDSAQVTKCEACRVECANANMYADHLRGKRHRGAMLRLERRLHDTALENAAKGVQDATLARTWATVSGQNPANDSNASAGTPVSRTTTLPTAETSRDGSQVRRSSYPGATSEKHAPSRRAPNQLPHASESGAIRQALEQQQRAATILIGNVSKQDVTDGKAYAMRSLRSNTSSASGAREAGLQPSSAREKEVAQVSPAYSLVDFMASPATRKPSRRKEQPESSQAKSGPAWGFQDHVTGTSTVSLDQAQPISRSADSVVEEGRKTTKSFHDILREEEQEKKERDEYGESVWFVSRKPRSTSFETIVQEQRRQELAAEEERRRAAEDQTEEEMLQLVLEMSKHDAQARQSTGQRSGSKGTREGPERGSRYRKERREPRRSGPGGLASGTGPEDVATNSSRRASAKGKARNKGASEGEQRRSGNSARSDTRRSKRRHDQRCGAAVQATTEGRADSGPRTPAAL